MRCIGIIFNACSLTSSVTISAFQLNLEATQFTVILRFANSSANALVALIKPALAAL